MLLPAARDGLVQRRRFRSPNEKPLAMRDDIYFTPAIPITPNPPEGCCPNCTTPNPTQPFATVHSQPPMPAPPKANSFPTSQPPAKRCCPSGAHVGTRQLPIPYSIPSPGPSPASLGRVQLPTGSRPECHVGSTDWHGVSTQRGDDGLLCLEVPRHVDETRRALLPLLWWAPLFTLRFRWPCQALCVAFMA